MKKWLFMGLALTITIVGWYFYDKFNSKIIRVTPELVSSLHKTVSEENEAAIIKPEAAQQIIAAANPDKNVYFGDLHVHTSWSFDSYISGNRLPPDEAYQFARGKPLTMTSGEVVQISTPLDFVAITDHAESFGLFEGCKDPGITPKQKKFCQQFDNPSLSLFMTLREQAIQRPPKRSDYCGDDEAFCIRHGRTTWQKTQQAADDAYEPGVFTSFYSYEYSPVWPKGGSTHRNVIFRNRSVPDTVVSAYEAATAPDLWKALEATCTGTCEFLTIPHNLNRYYGKAFSVNDEDGNPYTEADWLRRRSFEPLVEVFQAKGFSECAIGVGTTDEECGFEQFFSLCKEGNTQGCAGPNSFARDGLKMGLQLEKELGFNPLQFGFIGSTDAHNVNPGDTEEWDYRGKSGLKDATAKKRLSRRTFGPDSPITHNPGGLAAVWAVENTRDNIFSALQAKESYATSGTRIKLRVFAGWSYEKSMLTEPNMVADAYAGGIPMGGELKLTEEPNNPKILVWATKDPINANLNRVQLVKGWLQNGEPKEQVIDIACSDGLQPDAGKCPDNGAQVELHTCQISNDVGDAELKVLWEDTEFDPQVSAFYYVRVLQNPTCRWSTYDAIRLGIDPIAEVSPTIQERAWSSAIWYTP